ncbi:MAG TPA: outer membrane beta-barrel protein [Chitinophagaceae bacterium]|nr:outer membrane beta-barrel protein [Chitinophagaceae bacterium]
MAKVKNLLLPIIFILYTPMLKAQFDADRDNVFVGGLCAGLNYTQVDGDNFAGYHKSGWNAGAVVYIKLADHIAASMELLYTQKGSRAGSGQVPKYANDQSTLITDYRIKLNYLEVPILINFFDRRKSNFGAGFSYGHLASSREIYKDGQGHVYENDAKLFPFRKSDVNFVLNGNAHLWKGLFFNLRFQYSLFSIRSAYNYITGREQQFNNLWTTRLLYIF